MQGRQYGALPLTRRSSTARTAPPAPTSAPAPRRRTSATRGPTCRRDPAATLPAPVTTGRLRAGEGQRLVARRQPRRQGVRGRQGQPRRSPACPRRRTRRTSSRRTTSCSTPATARSGICTGGSFPSGHTTTAYQAGITLATLRARARAGDPGPRVRERQRPHRARRALPARHHGRTHRRRGRPGRPLVGHARTAPRCSSRPARSWSATSRPSAAHPARRASPPRSRTRTNPYGGEGDPGRHRADRHRPRLGRRRSTASA